MENSASILLVEDDVQLLELVGEILSSRGYRVHLAVDAVQAIDIFESRSERIHLLVADIVMPGLSGPQLAAQLRGLDPAIQVLFTSGHSRLASLQRGLLGEEAEFLKKPYSLDDLLTALERLLGNTKISCKSHELSLALDHTRNPL